MNIQVIQALRKIKENNEDIFFDATRFYSIICDLLPGDEMDSAREWLTITIKMGAYSRLKQAALNNDIQLEISVLTDMLYAKKIDKSFAKEIVDNLTSLFSAHIHKEQGTINTINVKIIHPTNNSDVDVGLPENILLQDVFEQLIEANFLSAGQPYAGALKSNGMHKSSLMLDNGKTIRENGVANNDTIQTLVSIRTSP